jgi:hypothetical protein
MTIEVILRKQELNPKSNPNEMDSLPNDLLSLEVRLKELEFASVKLRESTDLLTEEFRSSEGEEAREYYEYVQDNLEILKSKDREMGSIKKKMNLIKGRFDSEERPSTSSVTNGAGGINEGYMV